MIDLFACGMRKKNLVCWSKGCTPIRVTSHQRKWGLGKSARIMSFFLICLFDCAGLSCGRWTLSCSVWNLVPWVEVEPGPCTGNSRVWATEPPGTFWSHLFFQCGVKPVSSVDMAWMGVWLSWLWCVILWRSCIDPGATDWGFIKSWGL